VPRFLRLGTVTALTVGALTAASVAAVAAPAHHPSGPPAGSEFHQTNLVAGARQRFSQGADHVGQAAGF